MKKTTKAAIFVTAAAALYGAAAYGVTRTLMDVAMKREAPKALKNKGSAQPVSYTHLDVYKRQISIWRWLLFILFFYFSVVLVVIGLSLIHI